MTGYPRVAWVMLTHSYQPVFMNADHLNQLIIE